MREKGLLVARLLIGLIFFVFGLNGLLMVTGIGAFMSPPPMNEASSAFMGGLAATGYMLHLIKITEIIGGALLLVNMYIPLSLAILAPIIVNILLFHVFLDTSGLIMAIVITLLYAFLVHSYKSNFDGLLASKVDPD